MVHVLRLQPHRYLQKASHALISNDGRGCTVPVATLVQWLRCLWHLNLEPPPQLMAMACDQYSQSRNTSHPLNLHVAHVSSGSSAVAMEPERPLPLAARLPQHPRQLPP